MVSEIAAVAVLYLPREHRVQAADPFTSLYVPAMHSVHAAPSAPVKPLLQVQPMMDVLLTEEWVCAGQASHVDSQISPVPVEYFPSEQAVHGDDPFMSLYVPVIHATHAAPSGPV